MPAGNHDDAHVHNEVGLGSLGTTKAQQLTSFTLTITIFPMSYNASGHDAFLLLSLPNCTLRTPTASQTGALGLECVTLPPSAKATFDRDVFLVLSLNGQEIPLDPARTVSVSQSQDERTYVFHGTPTDPLVVTLIFNESLYAEGPLSEDLETFDGVLSQYLKLNYDQVQRSATPPSPPQANKGTEDLRGRLLLRDEDTGEIVGELDRKVVVREDPMLSQRGHENDPVVIEIPEDASLQDNATAIEAFARNIPPEEHNWMTKSATLVRYRPFPDFLTRSHTESICLTIVME